MSEKIVKKFRTKKESEAYLNQITKSDYGYYKETDDYFSNLNKSNSIYSKTLRSDSPGPFVCYLVLSLTITIASCVFCEVFETLIPLWMFLAYFALTLLSPPRIFKYEVITTKNGNITTIDKTKKDRAEVKDYTFTNDPSEKLNTHFDRVIKNGMIPNKNNKKRDEITNYPYSSRLVREIVDEDNYVDFWDDDFDYEF